MRWAPRMQMVFHYFPIQHPHFPNLGSQHRLLDLILIGQYFTASQQVSRVLTSAEISYIFLLFKQPLGFNGQTLVNSTTSIANFNISQFAAEVGLGAPLGGTFMRVGPDPSS